jgi:hypothetical protein
MQDCGQHYAETCKAKDAWSFAVWLEEAEAAVVVRHQPGRIGTLRAARILVSIPGLDHRGHPPFSSGMAVATILGRRCERAINSMLSTTIPIVNHQL